MGRRVKVVSKKRREIDEDKLALAFLLLAKHLRERDDKTPETGERDAPIDHQEAEAA